MVVKRKQSFYRKGILFQHGKFFPTPVCKRCHSPYALYLLGETGKDRGICVYCQKKREEDDLRSQTIEAEEERIENMVEKLNWKWGNATQKTR